MAGRIREAREAFQQAVELDPKNEKARSYLQHIRDAVPAVTPFPGALPPVQPAAMQPPPSSAAPAPKSSGIAALAAAVELAARDDLDGGEFAPSPWDQGPAAPATIELEQSGGIDLEAVSEKSDL